MPIDPVSAAAFVAKVYSAYQDWQNKSSLDSLSELAKETAADVKALKAMLSAFEEDILKKVFDARVGVAKAHLELAQDELTKKDPAAAEENLSLAGLLLAGLMDDLNTYASGEPVTHEQTYFDALVAATGIAASSTTLYAAAIGVPPANRSAEIESAFHTFRDTANVALDAVRAFNSKHFVLRSQGYLDGPLRMVHWGYEVDHGGFIEVIEGLATDSASLKQAAQEEMDNQANKRCNSLAPFSAIQDMVSRLVP